jgi:hypothetical protein
VIKESSLIKEFRLIKESVHVTRRTPQRRSALAVEEGGLGTGRAGARRAGRRPTLGQHPGAGELSESLES